MKKYYLVYKSSFDSDFDNYPSNYLLGLYENKSIAEKICKEDVCKRTYYKELEINKNEYIEL